MFPDELLTIIESLFIGTTPPTQVPVALKLPPAADAVLTAIL
jgi:hypothetical protein